MFFFFCNNHSEAVKVSSQKCHSRRCCSLPSSLEQRESCTVSWTSRLLHIGHQPLLGEWNVSIWEMIIWNVLAVKKISYRKHFPEFNRSQIPFVGRLQASTTNLEDWKFAHIFSSCSVFLETTSVADALDWLLHWLQWISKPYAIQHIWNNSVDLSGGVPALIINASVSSTALSHFSVVLDPNTPNSWSWVEMFLLIKTFWPIRIQCSTKLFKVVYLSSWWVLYTLKGALIVPLLDTKNH